MEFFFLEIDKLIIKFKWKNKEAKTRKNILRSEKLASGVLALPDVLQYTATDRKLGPCVSTHEKLTSLFPFLRLKLSDLPRKNPLQGSYPRLFLVCPYISATRCSRLILTVDFPCCRIWNQLLSTALTFFNRKDC